MRSRVIRIMAGLVALLLIPLSAASAEGVISTTVVMRVSQMTQNAVVDAGKDFSMEVNIDGVAPTSYQWYFNDAPIVGANQKVYSIVNAAVENAGVYRMDAFDANGKMLVSMDIAVRVIDKSVPKSGDHSIPVGAAMTAMGIAGVGLVCTLRKRTEQSCD